MDRMPYASDENLSLEVVVSVDREYLFDNLHSLMSCVVQSADEWTRVVSSNLRNQQYLVWRKNENHVHLDTISIKSSHYFEPLYSHRTLYDNVGPKNRKIVPFTYHSLKFLT